ncbi:MAG TPA: hypothetical protein VGJ20_28855 [Xanthobacteraceae bacterium]|jgi:hypothetical protein
MFDDAWIEHRGHLTPADFERAEAFVRDGVMSEAYAINCLRGWADDYAWTAEAESKAAADFEDKAYGGRND